MSIFSSSKCVLLLSDEGIGVYDAGADRVRSVELIPWNTEDFEDAVAETILKKCRGKSVTIVNDMVEQHYRKERIPKVSPLDRANIIKRRVATAFPAYPIRSALKLGEKLSAKDGQAAGDSYLFAAVPLSENIKKTLAAVQRSYVSVSGFCLLPVESSRMVHALSKKLAKISENPSTWTIFVGQHQNGGLRQIVTKNGDLALTRITPISDSDTDHDRWASDVASELKGTMSYLTRFGFDAMDGLDVIVVANKSVADSLEARVDFECNLNVLTAGEAARLLDMRIGSQSDERYADPLHIGWLAKKKSLVLPLQVAQLDSISGPAKAASVVALLLAAGCLYFGYVTASQLMDWAKISQDFDAAQMTLEAVKLEHEAEIEKKKSMGVDFALIEESTKVYQTYERKAMKPLRTFELIGRALGPDIHINGMNVTASGQDAPVIGGTEHNPPPVEETAEGADGTNALPEMQKYDVVINIRFPAALDPEKGVQKIADLEKRLKKNLPKHQVRIIKQVADLTYTGSFVGEASSQKNKDGEKKEDYEARILIRGELL